MSSRSFDGVNQFLRALSGVPVTASMAGWFKTSTVGDQSLQVRERFAPFPPPGAVTDILRVFTFTSGATNKLRASFFQAGSLTTVVQTTTTMVLGEWSHYAVTASAAAGLTVYLNGGGKANGNISFTPRAMARHGIAAGPSIGDNPFNGQMAHAAGWGKVLTDDEVASLALGRMPAPGIGEFSGIPGLVFSASLDNQDFAEYGDNAGAQITWGPQNGPTFSDDDPNVYPLISNLVG